MCLRTFVAVPVAAAVAAAALASQAWADGCYLPLQVHRRMPEIAAQRAVLAWKDGQETLVIESALDSESQRLGWLIPVPAVPQTIEKAGPGTLKTLSFCLQPEITHDIAGVLETVIVGVIVGNLLLGVWLFKRRWFLFVVLLILFLLLLWMLGFGLHKSMGPTRTVAGKVQVEKTVAVGSYDVSVLRPSTQKDLNAWLQESGFASLPGEADATVNDYIAQGWVFAAIKLTRAEAGANVPHPIKMVFPAQEPVYPLRLTAVAGGSPEFEIFVIADEMAACDPLPTEFCDRFVKREYEEWFHQRNESYFRGVETSQLVGHPGITSLMWDECVVTKLSGTIPAGAMQRDLRFDRRPFKAIRQHLYSEAGALLVALIFFVGMVGAWLFVSMPIWRKRIAHPDGAAWYLCKVILPVVVLVVLCDGILFASLPKIDRSETQVSLSLPQSHNLAAMLALTIKDTLDRHPEILHGTEQEIGTFLLANVDDPSAGKIEFRNWVLDQELRVEDSPGNFSVEKQADKIVVCAYDKAGRPCRIEKPIPGPSTPR